MQRLLSLIGLTLLVFATPAGAQKRALSPSDQQNATALTKQPQPDAASRSKQGKAAGRQDSFETQRKLSDYNREETLRSNAMRKTQCPPNCAGTSAIQKARPARSAPDR